MSYSSTPGSLGSDDFQAGLEAALSSISLSRWPDEQERIVLALSTAVMDSGIVENLRRSVLKEAEVAATEALTNWWTAETLPEDDTSSVQDVAKAIRALR